MNQIWNKQNQGTTMKIGRERLWNREGERKKEKKRKVIGAKPDIFFVQAPLINGGDTIRNKTLL
jgi:hypothetical protein